MPEEDYCEDYVHAALEEDYCEDYVEAVPEEDYYEDYAEAAPEEDYEAVPEDDQNAAVLGLH